MLKCLIVEDNLNYVIVLEIMLHEISVQIGRTITIIGKAKDYDEAEKSINAEVPDIVFLDLDLTDSSKTGHHLFLNVLLPKFIPVIIITDQNNNGLLRPHYSLFNIPLIDKPINENELLNEVKKFNNPNYKEVIKSRYALFSGVKENDISVDRIKLKSKTGEEEHIVFLSDLVYIEAAGQVSHCIVKDKVLVSNEEFGDLKKRLDHASLDFTFIQIGRSHLFNKRHISGTNTRKHTIKVSNGQYVPVSEMAFNRFIGK